MEDVRVQCCDIGIFLILCSRTHQKNRPFLLPQIRKNDDRTVRTCTAEARQLLGTSKDSSPTVQAIRIALDKICELKGVGPATGTLVLSVFQDGVPFFEDELYAWLLSDSKTKLKYNVKEYLELLDKLQDVRGRLKMARRAWDFEKVAYVCEHWDHVEVADKKQVTKLMQDSGADGSTHGHANSRAAVETSISEVKKTGSSQDRTAEPKSRAKPTQAHQPNDSKSKRKASLTGTAATTTSTQRTKRVKT